MKPAVHITSVNQRATCPALLKDITDGQVVLSASAACDRFMSKDAPYPDCGKHSYSDPVREEATNLQGGLSRSGTMAMVVHFGPPAGAIP